MDIVLLEIINASLRYFVEYEELRRLKVWTRPDYDDKVAISPFWISREAMIDWKNKNLSTKQLLVGREDYR